MTALTMPARPKHDAGLRPVPWRRMAWLTWLQMHHAYAADCHPASSLACTINFTGRYAVNVNIIRAFLQVVPALIGAFAGAPVLARELETGTFRFVWTQGIGRWRWTLAKLVPLAVAVAAAAAA